MASETTDTDSSTSRSPSRSSASRSPSASSAASRSPSRSPAKKRPRKQEARKRSDSSDDDASTRSRSPAKKSSKGRDDRKRPNIASDTSRSASRSPSRKPAKKRARRRDSSDDDASTHSRSRSPVKRPPKERKDRKRSRSRSEERKTDVKAKKKDGRSKSPRNKKHTKRHKEKSRSPRVRRRSRSRSKSPRRRRRSRSPHKKSANGNSVVKREPSSIKQEKPTQPVKVEEETKKPEATKDLDAIAEELRQKEVLYQAKMQLQERIRASQGLPVVSTAMKKAAVLKPEEAAIFANTRLSSEQQFQDLRSKVAAKLASVKDKLPPAVALPTTSAASPTSSTGTPAADQPKPVFQFVPEPGVSRRPVRKAFKFVEKGTYEKQAQKERLHAKLSKLSNTISTAAKQTGISSAVRLAIVTPSGAEVTDDLPEIEWWDRILLDNAENYDSIPDESMPAEERYKNSITNLIEHPVQLKPPDADLNNVCIKAHLTKKERKRLRRLNRKEIQREQMEKIRLGLEKPPEPKVKIANLMRVLGNDAIQDPTKMEAFVKNQVAERQRKHLEANAERKLTKEQRGEKKTRKIMEDTSIMVHVAVYKVLSLANPSKRFKILMNAKQLQMTGAVVGVEDMHVVVVEGGAKQQKFYKNLMMKRINWKEELVGQKKGVAKDDDEGQRNECVLVWEGVVPTRSFNSEPRLQTFPDHKSAREFFSRHDVPQYWDLSFSHSVLLSSNE